MIEWLWGLTVGALWNDFKELYSLCKEPVAYEVVRLDPMEGYEPVRIGNGVTVYRKVIPASEWDVADYL